MIFIKNNLVCKQIKRHMKNNLFSVYSFCAISVQKWRNEKYFNCTPSTLHLNHTVLAVSWLLIRPSALPSLKNKKSHTYKHSTHLKCVKYLDYLIYIHQPSAAKSVHRVERVLQLRLMTGRVSISQSAALIFLFSLNKKKKSYNDKHSYHCIQNSFKFLIITFMTGGFSCDGSTTSPFATLLLNLSMKKKSVKSIETCLIFSTISHLLTKV